MGMESKKFLTCADDASESLDALFAKGRLFAAELDNQSTAFDKASCLKRRFLEKALSRLTRFAERILARCTKLIDYCDSHSARFSATKGFTPTDSVISPPSSHGTASDEKFSFPPASPSTSRLYFPQDPETGCFPERIAHAYIPNLFSHSQEDLLRILPDEAAYENLTRLVSAERRKESFGATLARLREKQGLKISDFSGLTQLSPTQYNQYKNDEDTPHRFKLQRIITGMRLSLADARELWQKAGYNEYKPEDRLFFACLEYGVYDLRDINTLLYFFFRDAGKLIPIPAEKE